MEKYILSSIFRLDKTIPFIFDLSRVHDSSIKRSHPTKVSSPQLTISKPARLNPAVRGPGASNEQRRRGPKHAGPPAPPRSSLTVGPPHTVTATRDRHKHWVPVARVGPRAGPYYGTAPQIGAGACLSSGRFAGRSRQKTRRDQSDVSNGRNRASDSVPTHSPADAAWQGHNPSH